MRMSSTQLIRPVQIIFRLSPLMAALAVFISPITAVQADETTTTINKLEAPVQLPSYRFQQHHVLGTSIDVVVNTANQ